MPANFTSVNRQRKLVIDNQTEWDTRALRTVFLKVINENIKYEGPLRHVIRAKVVYSRSNYSGYAYLNSGTMKIRLPKPTDKCPRCVDGNLYDLVIDGELHNPKPCKHCNGSSKSPDGLTLDIYKVANLFEHELAHCRGYQHKGMCALNSWRSATPENYPYLAGMTIGARVPKAKPKPTTLDLQQKRYQAVLESIERWERVAKRAARALRKQAIRRKYYERIFAATKG